ncbi:MAG: 50S ribosomal protein L35 [Brevinemataceae bacterium]
MPKMKTNRSVAKRYTISSSGKVRRSKCGKRHLLEHKTPKVKRNGKGLVEVRKILADKIKLLMPFA